MSQDNQAEAKALYYPYVQFQDEGWLKRSAFLWDRMGRIVPDEVREQDTDTVKELRDAAGFVVDERPYSAAMELGEAFLPLLRGHEEEWRTRYGVDTLFADAPSSLQARSNVPWAQDGPAAGGAWRPARIASVYAGKMYPEVREALVATGFARPSHDCETMYMHREMADLYMAALAGVMARGEYQPVTDNSRDHWLAGRSLEQLARGMLRPARRKHGRPRGLAASPGEHARRSLEDVATYAIQMALPADMEALTVRQIISFRRTHRDEMRQFRADVAAFIEESETIRATVGDPEKAEQILRQEYQKKVAKSLDRLDRFFAKLGTATLWATLCVSPCAAVVHGLSAAGLPAEPISEYIGAYSLSMIPIIYAKQKEARDRVGASLYLLHAEEHFGPRRPRAPFSYRARHFFFRV